MSRLVGRGIVLRSAVAEDAEFLRTLWPDLLRRGDAAEQVADLVTIIESRDGKQSRIVVAECDGELAAGVLLQVDTLSPLNLEPVVITLAPTVVERFRGRGIGLQMIEATLAFAEVHGVSHVATAAYADSREANRLMARLGFAARATYRIASVSTLRTRLAAMHPAAGGGLARSHLAHVLASRRSLRRGVARA